MKYTVEVNGYGAEMVLGTLSKEQYDFWIDKAENDDEGLHSHLFWDPWSDEDGNPIVDDEDPRWLGQWYELDNIEHCNGALLENCTITVYDENGDTVFETDDPKLENVTYTDTDDEDGYYIKAWSSEKGNFFTGEIEVDNFDSNNMKFYGVDIDSEVFVTNIEYKGEDLSNDGGDTIGKAYGYSMFES